MSKPTNINKKLIATLLLIVLIGPVQAQVRKCTGPDGKVTYSDFVCVSSTSKEERVSTNANTIDTSAYRQEVQREKVAQAVDDAMLQSPSKCKFAFYTLADTKGQELAAAAKQECLHNLAANASGQPTSLEAYGFWKDHHQIMSTQRSSARATPMNCVPNGFRGFRCN